MSDPLSPEDRDRLIEAAEVLKRQRTLETTTQVIVALEGREWAPGRSNRTRYFIVRVPKNWGDFDSPFDRAKSYVDHEGRFPLFYEMARSLRYDPVRVCRILSDSDGDGTEITRNIRPERLWSRSER